MSIANMEKFPAYSLPKLYGWHMIPRHSLTDRGKIYKWFGGNWWDLLMSDKLPLHKNEITLNTRHSYSIVLINLGTEPTKMITKETGDIYNVLPGMRSTVNNTDDKRITLYTDTGVVGDTRNEMHLTKIGSIWLVLLHIEQVREGTARISKSVIFTDFLLMCGIPDKYQYLESMGIEDLTYVKTKGWEYVYSDIGAKNEFTDLVLEQWSKVNPTNRKKLKRQIPPVIQWIWLRKDPKKKEYGPLQSRFYKFMRTWIERNPGFTFNIWSDNPNFVVPKQFEGEITVRGPQHIAKILDRLPKSVRGRIKYLYKNHGNPAARSDVLRQVILYFEGGIYADVNDGMCLAPFEEIIQRFDYIIGLEPVMYVNNAIIASRKRHPFSQAMIVHLAYNSTQYVEEWTGEMSKEENENRDNYIVSTTGPIALTYVIFGLLQRKSVKQLNHTLLLPSSSIYPNYWIRDTPDKWLKPLSITAHWDFRDFLAE